LFFNCIIFYISDNISKSSDDISKSLDISESYSIPQQLSCSASDVLISETNNNKISPAKQMQQTNPNTYKRYVPEPDSFNKRQKWNADIFQKSGKELSYIEHLNKLYQHLLKGQTPPLLNEQYFTIKTQ